MFQKARIKLTAWYLLIIVFVSLSFSTIIYSVQVAELNRFAHAQRQKIERQFISDNFMRPEPPVIDPQLIAETQKRLLNNLLLLNGIIILSSSAFGYFLAGKTLRPIKEMVEEQDRFISDSSHELRTPLTSLKSAMEVSLRDKNLTLTEAKKLIADNIEDVNRLQKLSDSLIQLTKRNTKHSLNTTPLTIKSLVDSSLKQIKPQADLKKIKLNSNLKNISFLGDKDKLENLIVILLDNAIKYSPKNTKINLKSWKTKHFVHLSIKDQGIGINEQDLANIFNRFFRADTSRTSLKASGYGLGLSIAKMIVDEHRGSISVKSLVGKGSTFTVKLPLKVA